MTTFRLFLLISLLGLLLTACGQRGPLYLPDESAPVVVPAQVNQPPAAPPAVPANPLNSGFESEDTSDEDDSEDDEENGL